MTHLNTNSISSLKSIHFYSPYYLSVLKQIPYLFYPYAFSIRQYMPFTTRFNISSDKSKLNNE